MINPTQKNFNIFKYQDKSVKIIQSKILVLICLIFNSCSSTKPDWINHLETDSKYLKGIGQASKEVDNYREKAFKNAEREIARQLEVEITSSSTIETVAGFAETIKEQYTEIIKTNINQSLSELEKLDEYNEKKTYYVLIGLNKEKYYKQKKTKKNRALDRINNIMLNLDQLNISDQLANLNTAIGLLIKNDMLYEKDKDNNFLYTLLTSKIDGHLNKISVKMQNSIYRYHPLLNNKISILFSIKYNEELISSLPISISLDDILVQNIFSNDKSETKIILDPNYKKEEVVKIILQRSIFDKNENLFYEPDLTLSSFIVRPVINEFTITTSGPLMKKQEQRIKSIIEQFLLTNFHYEKSKNNKTIIHVSLEREDIKQVGDKYPYVVFANGNINVKDSSGKKNVYQIHKEKGLDFESSDKAFNTALNKILNEQTIPKIFRPNQLK